MNEKEHFRLFVAIQIPEQIRNRMAAVQTELREKLPERSVTWTKAEQLHLTLKFLGNVETARISVLTEQLRAAVHTFAPFTLCAQGIGAFPDIGFPRVIWAGLKDPAGKLPALHRAVEEACRDFVPAEPAERFNGHATLGRAKRLSRKEAQNLSALLSEMTERPFGEWNALSFDLMRSELSSEGARHTAMASFLLGT
jgi:2'-5' RNA ligase